MSRAVFLDRDGVITRKAPEGEYVTRYEDMNLLPRVADAIRLLNEAGFRVIVVTNQRCVAKGILATRELEIMHSHMCKELAAQGARIDDVYYCPHEKHPPCSCRKPAPGMLQAAARAHNIDLTASWMIGDSDTDMQAGRNAGCKTARISSDRNSTPLASDAIGTSLFEVVHNVLHSNANTAIGYARPTTIPARRVNV